eukprot:15337675-Alexandrium_andersonii.AAC.1
MAGPFGLPSDCSLHALRAAQLEVALPSPSVAKRCFARSRCVHAVACDPQSIVESYLQRLR